MPINVVLMILVVNSTQLKSNKLVILVMKLKIKIE
jgi:hypothetical protein